MRHAAVRSSLVCAVSAGVGNASVRRRYGRAPRSSMSLRARRTAAIVLIILSAFIVEWLAPSVSSAATLSQTVPPGRYYDRAFDVVIGKRTAGGASSRNAVFSQLAVSSDDFRTAVGAYEAAFEASVRRLARPSGVSVTRSRTRDGDSRAPGEFIAPAADFDGDGRRDVIGLAAASEGADSDTLMARKGTNGTALWSRPVPVGSIPLVVPLGADGRPGVLAISVQVLEPVPGLVDVAEVEASFSAFSGSGSPLWRYKARGRIVQTPTGTVATGLPVPVGILHAAEAPADELLIAVIDFTASEVVRQFGTEIHVLSGVDGVPRVLGVATDGDSPPVPQPAPDLDDDGLDDVIVVTASADGEGEVTARRGSTGHALWVAERVPTSLDPIVIDAGDIDGDGADDIALGGSATFEDDQRPMVAVLDGAKGTLRYMAPGAVPVALGDVSGDYRPDVGVIEAVDETIDDPPRLGLTYRAYDVGGRQLYERSYAVSPAPNATSSIVFGGVSIGSAGDVDADGVPDLLHVIQLQVGDFASSDARIVSGRSGDAVLGNLEARPLLASVDGNGDDLASVSTAPNSVVVSALSGDAGQPIWRSAALDVHGVDDFSAAGADLVDDDAAEVIVNFFGEDGVHASVWRASDGRLLWQVPTKAEDLPEQRTTPSGDPPSDEGGVQRRADSADQPELPATGAPSWSGLAATLWLAGSVAGAMRRRRP